MVVIEWIYFLPQNHFGCQIAFCHFAELTHQVPVTNEGCEGVSDNHDGSPVQLVHVVLLHLNRRPINNV